MTKKHFIALAKHLRSEKPPAHHLNSLHYWNQMVDKLADFCKSQNSAFDRERWLAYVAGECGPNGGKL